MAVRLSRTRALRARDLRKHPSPQALKHETEKEEEEEMPDESASDRKSDALSGCTLYFRVYVSVEGPSN